MLSPDTSRNAPAIPAQFDQLKKKKKTTFFFEADGDTEYTIYIYDINDPTNREFTIASLKATLVPPPTGDPITNTYNPYRYRFNGKEWVTQGLPSRYDYGARMYDPAVGRFLTVDPLAGKYPSSSPYNYVDNNPILRIDPDGRDWRVSTYKDKNGNTRIRLTFYTAVINTSGKDIDMPAFMEEQRRTFQHVFSQGNVDASLIIKEISSKADLDDYQSLIEILPSSSFSPLENIESYVGGQARYGGKHISINAEGIGSNGMLMDKKTVVHEIGHTGGLIHFFENNPGGKFVNQKPIDVSLQNFYNSANDPILDLNFMNYSKVAVDNQRSTYPMSFFNNNVGKATKGQVQTIINNFYDGNLNSNDFPKE